MGLLKNMFGGKKVEVDPADLVLPSLIPTKQPGLSLRKAEGTASVTIDIVGESFRAANVAAVATAAQGRSFEIYLVAEPNNQHDKNAVAVYAANVHIGYISKPSNKQWSKWVADAFQREELLWGSAKAVTNTDTSSIGVFGHIMMPMPDSGAKSIEPKKITNSALIKAMEKVITLAASADEPETVAQLRSIAKKSVSASSVVFAHAKWIVESGESPDHDDWDEVLVYCEDLFSASSESVYATDADDIDILGSLTELADKLETMKPSVS